MISLRAIVLFALVFTVLASEGKKEVAINKFELCDGCVTFFEEFHRALAREMTQVSPHTTDPLDGLKIAQELCDSPIYQKLDRSQYYACLKFAHEDSAEALKGIEGNVMTHDIRSAKLARQLVKDVCFSELGACQEINDRGYSYIADHAIHTFESPRDECLQCKAVVHDLEFMMRRKRDNSEEELNKMVEDELCQYLPYRHDRSIKLEDMCLDMVDEFQSEIVGTIVLRDQLKASKLHMVNTLADKICVEIVEVCEEEREDEL
eukprot:TRINITY_DN782478_c0_g1_i1.p1 TRINITY_DN782478_c0_g1~~TRINITY_DN782478_c0_g1_i1.p1  ORF type:complete len:277 (+),score=71.76 TRINITY_DN782478_c0_g1_i1:44-832(+)